MTERKYDLREALARCRASAVRGYDAAGAQLNDVERVLAEAREQTEESIKSLNTCSAYLSDLNKQLEKQLKEIAKAFERASDSSRKDLKTLKSNLSRFTIALFGRTMAGKSTLMEVLTHGDGKAIGNGAQRKTRDIRSYEWNGLSITDVPGIGAFDGKKDEEKAFEAAKSADMIIFLMSDDGVQSQEAECFRTVLEMGKPVLCVMNVKASVDMDEEPAFITEDIDEAFDMNRLGEIRRQFTEYGKLAGQDWNQIPFVFAHLRAAFLAQHTRDREKSRRLTMASRIMNLTDAVAMTVATRGEFYRSKTFTDAVSAPLNSTAELLLEQSMSNGMQAQIVADKRKALEKWTERFEKNAYESIAGNTARLKSEMYAEAHDFAAKHLGDKEINSQWREYVKKLRLDDRGKELVGELSAQAESEIRELTRSMGKELEFSLTFAEDAALRSRRILDVKKVFDWGMVAVSGGLTVAALIFAPAAPVLFLAAMGVGLIKELADNFIPEKEKLVSGEKARVEEQLKRYINSLCEKYRASLEKNAREIFSRLNLLSSDLAEISLVTSKLAKTQWTLGQRLNDNINTIDKRLVREALEQLGCGELSLRICSAAVLSGFECVITLVPGSGFPEEKRMALSSLLGKSVRLVEHSQVREELLNRIAAAPERLTIREGLGGSQTAVLRGCENPYTINRAKLGGRLCGVIITK